MLRRKNVLIKLIVNFSVFRIRIRIIWPDPDPDPHQEALIWIRVPTKNRDKLAYKSTKIIKIKTKKHR